MRTTVLGEPLNLTASVIGFTAIVNTTVRFPLYFVKIFPLYYQEVGFSKKVRFTTR